MRQIHKIGAGILMACMVIGLGTAACAKGPKKGAQRVIDTTSICKDVQGFRGPVPVKIYVTGNVIDSVVALPNHETPRFFKEVLASGLLDKWKGVTLKKAATMKVDAVSGATYSSTALIENVQRGAAQQR